MSIAIDSEFSASRNSESTGLSDPSLQEGFSGPIRLFSENECKEIIAHLRRRVYKPSPRWNKDQAVSDGFLFRLATRTLLVSHIIEYLGPDIILWGCSVVEFARTERFRRRGNFSRWPPVARLAQPPRFRHAHRATISICEGLRAGRIPDYRVLTWPFKFLEEPKPPAMLVHGKAPTGSNHLVPPPRTNERITPVGKELRSPIPEDPNRSRTHHHVFRGPTPVVEEMESHCSVLRGGSRPHPPHIHPARRISCWRTDAEGSNSIKTRIAPGSVVYYPSGQYHTIENPNATSIAYLMFKWRAPASQSLTPLGTSFFHFRELLAEGGVSKRKRDLVFEAGTSQLAKLRCHFSRVPPGDGYAPHIDAHDVAIVMLGGEVEVMNRTIKAHDVLFCPAGNEHGLRNASASQATYLVFEFHGHGSALSSHDAKNTGRPFISTRKLRRAFQRLKAAIFAKSR